MPETERDIFEKLKFYRDNGGSCVAYIESVHSMPKQGVSSTFTFGRNYGFLRGCLCALEIPYHEVTPQKWQKALECLSHGDKNVTKARAQQLFPKLKITHAIADALLIAEYGRRQQVTGKSGSVARIPAIPIDPDADQRIDRLVAERMKQRSLSI